MNEPKREIFQELVWNYYHDNARSMPWRDDPSPYNVVVSEFMLQQTQVSRVTPKFQEFVGSWPDWSSLAAAPQSEVVRAWKGLGYNRRALWVHGVAIKVMKECDGALPQDVHALTSCKGIGPNTAGAIMAYAFDLPVVFIETNIRRVYIHHFFGDSDTVDDRDLIPLIDKTLDREHPREWYWALMDYGSYLATQVVNPNRRSKHYVRQSAFEGSLRQVRGSILEYLLLQPSTEKELQVKLSVVEGDQLSQALQGLLNDGFLHYRDGLYTLK